MTLDDTTTPHAAPRGIPHPSTDRPDDPEDGPTAPPPVGPPVDLPVAPAADPSLGPSAARDVDGPDDPPADLTADLTADLRELASLRSRSSVRDRVLPALDALLPEDALADREARFARRQALIDRSIAAMTDPAHRSAAAALLGSSPDRWQPLTRRGPRAASAFRLGWDAYRRRRDSTGVSLLDETLDALAATMRRDHTPRRSPEPTNSPTTSPPATIPPATVPPATIPLPIIEEDRSRRLVVPEPLAVTGPVDAADHGHSHRPLVAGVAAAIVIVALIGGWSVLRDRDADTAGDQPSCGNLVHAVGETVEGAPEHLRAWSAAFRAAAEQVPEGTIRCASPLAERDAIVFQVVTAGDGSGAGAIVGSTDDETAFWLSRAEYDELDAFTFSSVNPERTLGLPVARLDVDGGARVVQYTVGLTYQEALDAPAHSIMGQMYEEWTERGGLDGELGAPLTDDYFTGEGATGGIRQDFLHARLGRSYLAGDDYEVLDYEPDELVLPSEGTGIVRTSHGAGTWWLGDEGIRRWVPDDAVDCLAEAHGMTAVDGVAMAAIAPLRLGPPMEACR